LLFWEIEKKSDAKERPEILEQAFAFGKQVVQRG